MPTPSVPTTSVPASAPAPVEPPHAQPEDAAAVIEQLLAAIADSKLVFVRNGSDHTGAAAAAHIRKKREHYAKEIHTPEDFIAKAATKSELSGKPYLVKLADGTSVTLAEWLGARLAEWRVELAR
ncbi:MAG TPA: DUF5329 family protein [Planctomycetota bacterium]|nr:DUF5329 family protein [Planctomycetota bacterium]